LHPANVINFDVDPSSQIPIKDTLDIIKSSHKVPSSLIPLIESHSFNCFTTIHFFYNNQFYEQISGAAMGSPIIANIFMEYFEKEALRKMPKKPEISLRRRHIRDLETRQSWTL